MGSCNPLAEWLDCGHMKYMNLILSAIVLVCSMALVDLASAQDKVTPLAVGSAAPNFDLPGIDGKNHSLQDYDSDVLMVLFTCNHCPTAQAYEDRVKQIVTDYKDKSFSLVAISPNDPTAVRLDELGYAVYADSFEEMKLHAAANGFNFPYLYDGETQTVSKAYGVLATPHVFILDKDRKLRFQGRIDDSEAGDNIKSRDTRNAIDALLAGKPVPVETTRVFGCSTKWANKEGGVAKADARWNALPVSMETIDAAGVKALAANKTKKLRLINVWATWCGPCIAEMPEFVKMSRMYQGRDFEVITISRDEAGDAARVAEFVKTQHLAISPKIAESVKAEGRTTNNYHYTSDDYDALADALDEQWRGPLPYSVLIAPGGKILYRQEGEVVPVKLRQAIVDFIGRTYAKK
jgi:thiol-disulfide isomerase/thioredoxin